MGPGIPKNSLRIQKNHTRNLGNPPETSGTPPNTSGTPPNTSRTPREYPKIIPKSSENIRNTYEERTDWGPIFTFQKSFLFEELSYRDLEIRDLHKNSLPVIICQNHLCVFFCFLKVDLFFSLKMPTSVISPQRLRDSLQAAIEGFTAV